MCNGIEHARIGLVGHKTINVSGLNVCLFQRISGGDRHQIDRTGKNLATILHRHQELLRCHVGREWLVAAARWD